MKKNYVFWLTLSVIVTAMPTFANYCGIVEDYSTHEIVFT